MITLRSKLGLGFGGLLLILLAVSILSLIVLSRSSHSMEKIYRENYDSFLHCKHMVESLDAMKDHADHVLWNGPDTDPSLLKQWRNQFDASLELQRHNSFLPGEQELSDAVVAPWNDLVKRYKELTNSAESHRIYTADLRPRFMELKGLIDQIAEMNLQNMTSINGQIRRTFTSVRNALIVLAITGIGLAVLLVGAVGPWILRPLKSLTRSAHEIESGNLDLSIEVKGRDEVGQLAEAFASMASRLRDFRKLDHDRLLRTQQTTQRAIDSLPDAVTVLGPEGGIELANQVARSVFGFAPGPDAISLPNWMASFHGEVMRTGRACEPEGYRTAIQKFHAGEERFFLPHAAPLVDEAGKVVGVTIILADVTRLKQADEIKSDLVSTVSHELKTPLTSMRMATHMLSDEEFGPLTPKQATLLQTARENSDRLHRTLENLLGISRIESGRAPLRLEPMAASDLVNQSVEPLRATFQEKLIELICNGESSNECIVMADPTCVGYVLTNLLTNASKHTPPGGKIHVTFEPGDEFVQFHVRDNGSGIAAEHLPHIFEKFYRVPASSETAGAGLGLAIAKEIVEAHGGSLSAHSEFGHGSTFTFTLQRT